MVKNTTGGGKTKGQARKFANAPKQEGLYIKHNDGVVW